MAIKSKNVRVNTLSIYIAVCLIFMCAFNLLLGDVLHKKVHAGGVELAHQVHDLKLDVIANKEIVSALVSAHGFMLEPESGSAPFYFSALLGEKSDIFSYENTSLTLYHRPFWVVESYIFILLNLVIIGSIVWGYRWWRILCNRYDINFGQAARPAPKSLPKSIVDHTSNKHTEVPNALRHPIKDDDMEKLYYIQQGNYHLFSLFYCGHPFPENIDLESHFKVVITKGFSELPKTSVKLLNSGGLAITLQGVPQSKLDSYTHRLHQVIFQASLVYRQDLSRKNIKIGVCNYRLGADQSIVYQLTKSALEQAKQSPWRHILRIPFSHTHFEVLKSSSKDLPEYIAKKKFTLFFQPLFDLHTGEMLQHEALIRIRHESLGLLSARQFIPHLKTDTSIIQLDITVIEHVISILNNEPTKLVVSINLHSQNWLNPHFWKQFANIISTFKGADKLQFEISAEDFNRHHTHLTSAFEQIAAINASIVIDNILTSDELASLPQLSLIRGLKLGYELMHNIDKQLKQQKIVRDIVAKAEQLNLGVYGVGVETQQELHTLKQVGVSAAQGFYFTEPLQEFTQVTLY
ncbi:EAL domain-containing protein [Pseudoalteromonas sp. H105]|uniref:EAL domain-containing protein n=1 Tax=Pseudoalteromonas sp. H105 TaxID=1348393 RepID=UPI0009E8FAFC|nr:EAL domain-containing protein [Pseudoalteromonas sp. H105]